MMTFSWMPCSQSIAPDIATCTRTRLVFSFDYSGQGHGDVMASYAASVELRIVSCVGSPIACSSAATPCWPHRAQGRWPGSVRAG